MADLAPDISSNMPQFTRTGNGVGAAVNTAVDNISEFLTTNKRMSIASDAANTKAGKEAALNDTASTLFGALTDANNNIPSDVVTGVNKLQTVQKAEDAGRYPSGTANLHLEQLVQGVMQRHPDQSAEIFQYVKSQGFDHYLFRNLDASMEADKALREAKVKQDADMITVGRANGGPNLSDGDALSLGYNITAEQNKLKANKDALDAIETNLTIDDKKKASLKADLKDKTLQGISTILQTQASPILDNFYKYLDGAMDQPQYDKQVKDSIPQINLALESIRSQVRAAAARVGASPDDYKFIDDQIDGYQKHLRDVTSGDLSQFGQMKIGAEAMKTKLGIDTATAYPLATKLKSLIGPGWVNLFGGDPTYSLPADTLTALKNEMKGVKNWESPVGQATVQDIVSASKGQLNIKNVPADRVPGLVRGVMGTLKGSQEAIVNKSDTSMNNQNTWFNNYSNVINWSRNFNPNSPDTQGMNTAAQLLFNPGARTVIANYLANPDGREKAEALLKGSRSIAIQMINNVTSHPDFGPVSVKYDSKLGQFVANVNVPGSHSASAVSAANLALDHLIQTDQYEKELPSGATPLSRRNFWATGDARQLKNASGQAILQAKNTEDGSGEAEFKRSLEDFNRRLKAIPVDYQSSLPSAVANAQIDQESGWKNSVVSKQGAVGIAQIRPEDYPEYDPEKLKNDPAYALKARDEIMGKLLTKYNGNMSLALAEYHAGPNMKQWGPKTFKYVASILDKAKE